MFTGGKKIPGIGITQISGNVSGGEIKKCSSRWNLGKASRKVRAHLGKGGPEDVLQEDRLA